jgi:hypothetical protein
MTVPLVEGLLTAPYVSLAEFRASPTWVDSDNLIPGGSSNQQDAELTNVLLRASAWADNYCGQRFGAHTAFEQTRARLDKYGRLYLHPSNNPVRSITAFAYGTDPTQLNVVSSSDLAQQVWIEDARGVIVALTPLNSTFSGPLQFGPPAVTGYEMYVQYSYVAGYACTTLSESVSSGASSLPVVDATGFTGPASVTIGTIPGSVARIWDAGLEEAVQVAPPFTSATGPTSLPLASTLANSHAAGVAVSEMPAEVRMGVITMAVALLVKPDIVESSGPFAHGSYGPGATGGGGPAAQLLGEACGWLDRYKRVR